MCLSGGKQSGAAWTSACTAAKLGVGRDRDDSIGRSLVCVLARGGALQRLDTATAEHAVATPRAYRFCRHR
eukprot:194995-Chlamydomonas_euryale.AAC.4